jgi:hypothetical protein
MGKVFKQKVNRECFGGKGSGLDRDVVCANGKIKKQENENTAWQPWRKASHRGCRREHFLATKTRSLSSACA